MYLAIAGLCQVITGTICLWLLFTSKPLNQQKKAWGAFCAASMVWSFGLFKAYTTTVYSEGLFWLRFLNYAALWLPLFLIHFSFIISGEHVRCRKEIRYNYLFVIALFCASLVWPEIFIPSVKSILRFNFYPVPGPFYHLFTVYFIYAVLRGLVVLYVEYQRTLALRRQQLAYLFLGILLTFGGGGMTLLPVYNIPIEPYGALLAPFMMALATLVLVRYDIENIRAFVSRTLIFTVMGGLAILAPFWIGFQAEHLLKVFLGDLWWSVPVIAGIAFSGGAVWLQSYLQRQSEQQMAQESSRYQAMLLRASFGLGRIKELGKLTKFIVRLLIWNLKVNHVFIYLFEKEDNGFYLHAWRRRVGGGKSPKPCLSYNSPLVDFLYARRAPAVADEVKLRSRDDSNLTLEVVGREMDACESSIVLPCWVLDRLIGFVVLGPRVDRQSFQSGDLTFLAVLANQVALAIEGALSFDDLRRTQEHLLESEKMATIGTLAGGLSHQLNNRFTSLLFLSKNLEGLLAGIREAALSEEAYAKMQMIFKKIEDSINSSKDVVRGILNYSADNDGHESFLVRKLIDAALDMAGFKVRLENFKADIRIADDCPMILGNFAQLQEVLFNMIDNSFYSMMEKKKLGLGSSFEPTITFAARASGSKVNLVITDNGMGVKPENLRKVFSPFFSTKSLTRKGYGLGLYVMKQIVERNHGGRIIFRSEYPKYAEIELILPAYSQAASVAKA